MQIRECVQIRGGQIRPTGFIQSVSGFNKAVLECADKDCKCVKCACTFISRFCQKPGYGLFWNGGRVEFVFQNRTRLPKNTEPNQTIQKKNGNKKAATIFVVYSGKNQ